MRGRTPSRDGMNETKSGTKLTSAARARSSGARGFALTHRPTAAAAGLLVSPGSGAHAARGIHTCGLILVRSGSLHIEEGGVAYRVGPGEALLMPPLRRHRGLSEHPEELSFYWIHFTPAERRLRPPLRLPQHVRPARAERLAEL